MSFEDLDKLLMVLVVCSHSKERQIKAMLVK